MDRNLKRLMRNEAYLFCVVLLIFAGAEAVYSSYWIALAMAAVGIILLLIMIFTTRQRGKSIAAYVQTSVDRLSQSVAVNAPYPMATVQLSNGEILWHNHQLQRAVGTGESKVGQRLSDVLPESELEWVKAGQLEAPDDQVIRERRFRCLGYVPKSEAGEPEVIKADIVFLAMGFLKPQHPQFADNVVVCGDAASGASLVVRAIASGRDAAARVARMFAK
jgi:hypothetical protein